MWHKRSRLQGALVALLLGTTGCGLFGSDEAKGPDVTLVQSNDTPPHSSIAETIKRVLPSVVNVRVSTVEPDPFGLGTTQVKGEGSGVIIGRNGVILTNFHVVRGAVEVKVRFNDDHPEMTGTVIGAIPEKDLAIIRVDASDLEPITLGRSSALELGDPVLAIGFPLNLGGATVTRGIVSAKDRTITVGDGLGGGTEHLEGLLQTDAAINPGNSGGALINTVGQLVGINTAAAQAGSAENIGFAIAIDSALGVIREILETPPEEQAWMGVQVAAVDSPQIALQLGLPVDTRGVVIADVFDGSPAGEAGMRQGDLLLSVAGEEISTPGDLTQVLGDHRPGESVPVEVSRAGETTSLLVELAQRPLSFPEPRD